MHDQIKFCQKELNRDGHHKGFVNKEIFLLPSKGSMNFSNVFIKILTYVNSSFIN